MAGADDHEEGSEGGKGTRTATEGKEDKKNKGGVADYLQAPRRKKKSYVIMAFGKTFPSEISNTINAFVRGQYKQLAFSNIKTVEELARQGNRNIALLLIDDEMADRTQLLSAIRKLKEKKAGVVMPCLYLSRDPGELIDHYNKILLPYHEADEYIAYIGATHGQIFSRIKNGLESGNKRRARRYRIDLPIRFQILGQDKFFNGRLLDLSIHGALLKGESAKIFKANDQLKIHIPVGDFIATEEGEFLRLSAKVRRILISGDRIGMSFEFLSERQITTLTRFLMELVHLQMTKRPIGTSTKISARRGVLT